MRPLLLPLIGILSFPSFQPVLAADPLAAMLPADSVAFVHVSNLTNLRATTDHPLFRSLTSGEWGKALKPALEKLSGKMDPKLAAAVQEETGLTFQEILAKFPGAAAASVSVAVQEVIENEGKEMKGISFHVAADYTGDEALVAKLLKLPNRLMDSEGEDDKAEDPGEDEEEEAEEGDKEEAGKPLADWPEDYEEAVTAVDGANLHVWSIKQPEKMGGPAMGWTLKEGKLYVTIRNGEIKQLVPAPGNAGSPSVLGDTSAWKSLPETIGSGDLILGAHLEKLFGDIQETMRVKMEKGEMNTGLPINPLQAWTGAGLDQFRMAFMIHDLQQNELALHAGVTYAEKPAIVKVYAANGAGTPPEFVPADVADVSWGTLDWGKMFDNVKELAMAMSPLAGGGMESGLLEVKKAIGVDLRTGLIGQMGDDLWSASQLDRDALAKAQKEAGEAGEEGEANPFASLGLEGTRQVIGIELRDAKAFELSLKTVFNTVSPGESLFEDRDYMGKTIHRIKGLPESMPIAWLIEKDHLILNIGEMALLDQILIGMDKKPARPLVNEPHVKAAFAKLPEGQISSGYVDWGFLTEVLYTGFRKGFLDALDDHEEANEAAEMLKTFPESLSLPWYSVSRGYVGDKSLEIQLRLASKP